MEFREMKDNEIEQVGKLHNELAYYIQKETGDAYFDYDNLDLHNITEHLKSYINHPSRRIYIAEKSGEVVGFIAGEIISCFLSISSIQKVGYISGAYTNPSFRGNGIMKKLENCIIDFFQQNGIVYVEVNFITENKIAKNCWEGLGYKTFRQQARKKLDD